MASTFERVVSILAEHGNVEASRLTAATTLEEAGLDSLALVDVIVACEDEFGVEIDPASDPETVGEVAQTIEGLLSK